VYLFKPLTLNWCILIPITSCLHCFFDDHNFDPILLGENSQFFCFTSKEIILVMLVLQTCLITCSGNHLNHTGNSLIWSCFTTTWSRSLSYLPLDYIATRVSQSSQYQLQIRSIHMFTLREHFCNTGTFKYSFLICNITNSLPWWIVECSTTDTFKLSTECKIYQLNSQLVCGYDLFFEVSQ